MNDDSTTSSPAFESAPPGENSLAAPEVVDLLQSIENKRNYNRAEFVAIVHVYELDEAGSVISTGAEAKAFDLSRGGIGLHARRMYYPKSPIVLRLMLPGFHPRVLGGTVKYTRYLERGIYHIGIEFGKLPTSQEFRSWLEEQQLEMEREK